jgi:hypothetical protein
MFRDLIWKEAARRRSADRTGSRYGKARGRDLGGNAEHVLLPRETATKQPLALPPATAVRTAKCVN